MEIKIFSPLIHGDLLQHTHDKKMNAILARKKESIHYIKESAPSNQVIAKDNTTQKFDEITQKFLYSALILEQSRDHIYQGKWDEEEDQLMSTMWPDIWENIHNIFSTEKVKSTIWEQIHLNFYSTYNYNNATTLLSLAHCAIRYLIQFFT